MLVKFTKNIGESWSNFQKTIGMLVTIPNTRGKAGHPGQKSQKFGSMLVQFKQQWRMLVKVPQRRWECLSKFTKTSGNAGQNSQKQWGMLVNIPKHSGNAGQNCQKHFLSFTSYVLESNSLLDVPEGLQVISEAAHIHFVGFIDCCISNPWC